MEDIVTIAEQRRLEELGLKKRDTPEAAAYWDFAEHVTREVEREMRGYLLVVCDYKGRLRYTMWSTWRPLTISERRGTTLFALDDDPGGGVACYIQVRGEPKLGPPRHVEGGTRSERGLQMPALS